MTNSSTAARAALPFAVMLLTLTGCSLVKRTGSMTGIEQGRLAVISQSSPGVTLSGEFTSGVYSYDGHHRATILLYDGPIENPTQAVTIRLFWRPRAGRTPIQSTATNATIHYIIFPGGNAVGIYAGAGFLYPTSAIGGENLSASLWDANLSLADGTITFEDLLGKAVMKGKFRVHRDDAQLDRALRDLNIVIRNKIGYPRLVMRRP